jgi:hypothetical protein
MNPQYDVYSMYSQVKNIYAGYTVAGTLTSFKMFFTEPVFITPQVMLIMAISNFRILCIMIVVQAVFP